MTGKITNFHQSNETQAESPGSHTPEPTVSKTKTGSNIDTTNADLHSRTAEYSKVTHEITESLFVFCRENFNIKPTGSSKKHQAQFFTKIFALSMRLDTTPKVQKLEFLENYIPFLLLHYKEPISEDHFFSCLHHLKKLKTDPQFGDRIKMLEDMIRSVLEPQNKVTHEHVLKSLADISALPVYQSYNEIETAIGKDHMWRLVLDGAAQHDPEDPHGGIIGYEMREPGSVERLKNGYQFTLSQPLFEPVTTKLIQDIHKNVASLAVAQNRAAGKWGSSGVTCSYTRVYTPADENGLKYIPKGNFSHSGAFENMIDMHELLMPTTSTIELDGAMTDPTLKFESSHGGNPGENLQKLIDAYEAKMASLPLNDRYERLKTIVQFIHIAEINHPFQDGNCRTICTCLLNRELIRHGFAPTLLWDPNYLDLLSTEEIMLEALEGMKDFATLAKTKIYARAMTPEILARRQDQKMNNVRETLIDPTQHFLNKLKIIQKLSPTEKKSITQIDIAFAPNSDFTDENVGMLMNTMPNLTDFTISSYRLDTQKIFIQNKTYPNMKKFSYLNMSILPTDLTNYMAKFPNLEALTLSFVNFSPYMPENPRARIPEVYGHLPLLKEINLGSNNSHNPNDKKRSFVLHLKHHMDALVKSAPNLERVILPKDFAPEDFEACQKRYPKVTFIVEE